MSRYSKLLKKQKRKRNRINQIDLVQKYLNDLQDASYYNYLDEEIRRQDELAMDWDIEEGWGDFVDEVDWDYYEKYYQVDDFTDEDITCSLNDWNNGFYSRMIEEFKFQDKQREIDKLLELNQMKQLEEKLTSEMELEKELQLLERVSLNEI